MPRYSTVLGLAGVHFGILGLMVATLYPESMRLYAWAPLLAWFIGLAFLAAAAVVEGETKGTP